MIWMRLQRTSASVKNAFGLNVGFVGLFLRGKYANVDAPFADGYSRPPFLFAGGDAKDARVAVSFGWPDVVPAIFKTPNIAQVAYSVVVLNAVDVINFLTRPLTVDIKPSKPVSFVSLFVNTDVDVPMSVIPAGSLAGHSIWGCSSQARKHASFGVVVDEFAQTRGCKIGSSHDAVPSQSGQRPASVGSTVLASLF